LQKMLGNNHLQPATKKENDDESLVSSSSISPSSEHAMTTGAPSPVDALGTVPTPLTRDSIYLKRLSRVKDPVSQIETFNSTFSLEESSERSRNRARAKQILSGIEDPERPQ